MENEISLKGELIVLSDIGGTHITAALYEKNNGRILEPSRTRVEFNSKGSAKSILDAWTGAFRRVIALAEGRPVQIGIAMPGPFDYTRGISYIRGLDKFEALYGLDVRHILSAALEVTPENIRFRNDAESAIAGEVFLGAGSGHSEVIGLTLGTGFGTARSSNSLTTDLNWGSVPFLDSIADDYFSTRWFIRRFYEIAGLHVSGVRELAARAEHSKNASLVFHEFSDNLSEFLTQQFNGLLPELLLLCGNISKSHNRFLPELEKKFPALKMKLGELGEDSALLGAAALFNQQVN